MNAMVFHLIRFERKLDKEQEKYRDAILRRQEEEEMLQKAREAKPRSGKPTQKSTYGLCEAC